MPIERGLPKYPLQDAAKGDTIVTMGEYLGETQGKMGPNHNFMQLEDGQHVILSGGALNWRAENGQLVEGTVWDIEYLGKVKLKKGDWKGKEAHDFKFLEYEPHEIPEQYRSRLKRPEVAATKAEAPAAVAESPAPVEAMDELE